MLYDIGLHCTIVLGLWLVVDVAGARPRRLQALPMALLGVSSALWAGGELMIADGADPEKAVLGRSLLYPRPALARARSTGSSLVWAEASPGLQPVTPCSRRSGAARRARSGCSPSWQARSL